jgi:hypothetical protein
MKDSPKPGRHRKSGAPRLLAYHYTFRPRHCAGTSCIHDQADQLATRLWGLDQARVS